MLTFLISATSQSSSYLIVDVPGIESTTSWSLVRHADPQTNKALLHFTLNKIAKDFVVEISVTK